MSKGKEDKNNKEPETLSQFAYRVPKNVVPEWCPKCGSEDIEDSEGDRDGGIDTDGFRYMQCQVCSFQWIEHYEQKLISWEEDEDC